jgi:hypothetical protein
VKIKLYVTIVFLTFSLLVLAITTLYDSTFLFPPFQGLPDREIVFSRLYDDDKIYFINSDSTGLESKKVIHLNIENVPSGIYSWSRDGKYLAARLGYHTFPSNTGIPILFSSTGKVTKCPESQSPYGYGRVQVIGEKKILTVRSRPEPFQVIIFDMEECEVEEVLYTAVEDEVIYDASLSVQGDLLLNKEDSIIVLFKGETEEMEIAEGDYPSWSPDGKFVLYESSKIWEGIRLYELETREDRVITNDGWGADWSGDGQRIVYNQYVGGVGQLVVYDIETEQSLLLGVEDLYPNWR